MWNEEKRVIESQLSLGEQLLWTGRPRQGFLLRSSDAYMIPFSLLWFGFAVFWESSVWFTDAPIFFRLWGIPFVCIGLYMVAGRFFVDRQMRANTYYGLTNERAVIVSGLFSQQIKSLSLRNVTDLSLDEKANGVGTIRFGPQISQTLQASWPFGDNQQQASPSFELIPDSKKVYEIIRNAQRQLK